MLGVAQKLVETTTVSNLGRKDTICNNDGFEVKEDTNFMGITQFDLFQEAFFCQEQL